MAEKEPSSSKQKLTIKISSACDRDIKEIIKEILLENARTSEQINQLV